MLEMIVFALTLVGSYVVASLIMAYVMMKWFMRKDFIKRYTKMMVEVTEEIAEELDV